MVVGESIVTNFLYLHPTNRARYIDSFWTGWVGWVVALIVIVVSNSLGSNIELKARVWWSDWGVVGLGYVGEMVN